MSEDNGSDSDSALLQGEKPIKLEVHVRRSGAGTSRYLAAANLIRL